MRVALYHPWVYLKSGLERSLLELVRRSEHEWTIYTHHYDLEGTYPEFQEHSVVELSPSISVKRTYSDVIHASYRILQTRLPLENFDALVVSSEGVGDLIGFRNRDVPIIAFCH